MLDALDDVFHNNFGPGHPVASLERVWSNAYALAHMCRNDTKLVWSIVIRKACSETANVSETLSFSADQRYHQHFISHEPNRTFSLNAE